MTVHVQCPHCDQVNALSFDGAARLAGGELECGQCGEMFIVPRNVTSDRTQRSLVIGEVIRAEVTAGAYPLPSASAAAALFTPPPSQPSAPIPPRSRELSSNLPVMRELPTAP